MQKKLLQITNDFADQRIYVNLVRSLSKLGYHQVIYVPVRWESKLNGNRDDSIKNTEYHYSYILKRNLVFKLRFHRKLRIILNDLESKVNVSEIGLVHAHFLFSDGGVAYWLKKKHDIPYVVSVRATDIHYFFKLMPHLIRFGNKIIKEAEKVVFINYPYRRILEKKYLGKSLSHGDNKFKVIPNAIDDRWFKTSPKTKKILGKPINLLYVGRIVKRKKLDVVIQALKELNKMEEKSFFLDVVGDGDYMEEIRKISDDSVLFHGKIADFGQLNDIYDKSHVFVMPSVKETFGLVYVEALSQGLPIIYCKNEAVDGFFEKDEIGVAVSPNSSSELISAVLRIVENYSNMSSRAIVMAQRFNWQTVGKEYAKIYQESGILKA